MSQFSPVFESPTRAPRWTTGRVLLAVSWSLAMIAFLAAMAARARLQDLPAVDKSYTPRIVLGVLIVVAALFWYGVARFGNRLAAGIGVPALAMIGLVSAIHFALAAASRVGGQMLTGVIGPYARLLQGPGDEGLPCLLLAVLVMLRPKPGTAALSLVTVFLLMVITSGTLGVTALVFVSASVVLHEGLLAALGVTTRQVAEPGTSKLRVSLIVAMSLAIAIANAATLYAQFVLYRIFFQLYLGERYVFDVVVINGLIWGAIGAALGTLYGHRLRGIAA